MQTPHNGDRSRGSGAVIWCVHRDASCRRLPDHTVRLSNSWIIMNPGGPPTPDKPGISVVDYQSGDTLTTEEVTGSNPVRPTTFFESLSSAESLNGSQPAAVLPNKRWSQD